MNESELYKELGALTKNKEKWKESIPYVSSLLAYDSIKIRAKALWLLGEMGLEYTELVQDSVPLIASFCGSPFPLLRERAVNALGRIGRGDYRVIERYWTDLFRFASDEEPKVRLSFIWASENIATNTPDIYENYMTVFETLLHDIDDKVRIEMDTDHLDEGLQAALIGCPIYNFAVKHGYEALMPAMCNCDFPGIDFLHSGLIRPRTVSNGDGRCDNWFVSADSDKLKKYPPELKENGLLISRDWRDEIHWEAET